jgi:hypothetical protein
VLDNAGQSKLWIARSSVPAPPVVSAISVDESEPLKPASYVSRSSDGSSWQPIDGAQVHAHFVGGARRHDGQSATETKR